MGISAELIKDYLYGYKEMRLVSSEEVLNVHQNGKKTIYNKCKSVIFFLF